MKLSEWLNFTPRQEEARKAVLSHAYTLYGGAGGGGKSYWLRRMLVGLLARWYLKFNIPQVRVGLFCETYPALRDRQVSKIAQEFPPWLGRLKDSMSDGLGFYLDDDLGGGAILLRNLDDPGKYYSTEFAAVAIDELTKNEEQLFHDLRFRLRWPGIDQPKFLAATNPGGIGHLWVRRLWIDREYPPELADRSKEFAYIPAKFSDNPHLPPSYGHELASLPDAMRAALMDGSWDVFIGQVFAEWRREVHTCQPFEIPSWWRMWMSNDPGFGGWGVWHLYAADQDDSVYVVREWSFHRVSPLDQAREVAKDTKGLPVQFCVSGKDAFHHRPELGKSISDVYREGGINGLIEPMTDRRQGAQIVHEYLKPRQGIGDTPSPRLRIFAKCVRLIETLPSLVCEEHDPEMVADGPTDHWYDSLRYGLAAWHPRRSHAPVPPRFAPGTAGDVLGHEKVLQPEQKKGAFSFGK